MVLYCKFWYPRKLKREICNIQHWLSFWGVQRKVHIDCALAAGPVPCEMYLCMPRPRCAHWTYTSRVGTFGIRISFSFPPPFFLSPLLHQPHLPSEQIFSFVLDGGVFLFVCKRADFFPFIAISSLQWCAEQTCANPCHFYGAVLVHALCTAQLFRVRSRVYGCAIVYILFYYMQTDTALMWQNVD